MKNNSKKKFIIQYLASVSLSALSCFNIRENRDQKLVGAEMKLRN